MDPFWKHIVVAAAILAVVSVFARLTDWWLQRRPLPPEAVTRYRIFRRSVTVVILVIGLFSALLAIPDVRAVAGGLLASSALLGIVIGFAAQRTLGNFVAGLLIALAQPVRIGDRVEYEGTEGVVEEVGLTYTFIRAVDRRRLVVPNEKLASDTIINASIRSRETFAEIFVPVPNRPLSPTPPSALPSPPRMRPEPKIAMSESCTFLSMSKPPHFSSSSAYV